MTSVGAGLELDLDLPPKPEYVRAARLAVAALARLRGASDDVVEDIKLAVSEACTIALVAGRDGPTGTVRVLAAVRDGSMAVDVLSAGRIVDPDAGEDVEGDLGRPEGAGTPSALDRELSLPVIRGLVDELSIEPRVDGGSCLRMLISMEAPAEERTPSSPH